MSAKVRLLIEYARSKLPNFGSIGPASETDINEASSGMDLSIPDDYHFFLREYGTVRFRLCEISGVVAGKPMSSGHLNAFSTSREDIAKGYIPPRTLVINRLGYGPVFLLDCSTPPPDDAVYGWSIMAEVDEDLEQFPTFTDFLEFCVRQQSRYYKDDLKEGFEWTG